MYTLSRRGVSSEGQASLICEETVSSEAVCKRRGGPKKRGVALLVASYNRLGTLSGVHLILWVYSIPHPDGSV